MTREIDRKQFQLLMLAILFLGFFSLALTIAPSVRARAWVFSTTSQNHWLGYLIWLGLFWFLHRKSKQYLPERDPYLLPVTALLTGWGLLTIYRLTPTEASIGTSFGIRQTIWLALAVIVVTYGFRLPNLNFLRRYKYIWLTSGLLLTALTLIFGTNPLGFGPRLWLGCCGIYLQPSEPLKLLLVVYLAAYFADWMRVIKTEGWNPHRLNVLTPTIIMTSLAMLLLLVQRDLGTASIFIFLYSIMVYLATGWRWLPAVSSIALVGSSLLGYALFDVVRLRIEAWINPWLDPAGRSYQIVQSLMAVANGGVLGRGPGMGSPSLVPVAQSDFIFAAIAEESGLVGVVGLLLLIGWLAHRGLRIALHAQDAFRCYLAAGVTAHLVSQSILIIGGNLRLLPLTGVTLPFISYGGSSLLVSLSEFLILLHISASTADQGLKRTRVKLERTTVNHRATIITPLSTGLSLALFAAALMAGWWAFARGPDLLARTDNPRRAIADRFVRRGSLLDRNNNALVESFGAPGAYTRTIHYPDLGPVLGYTHPVYGQSGLEATLDPTLRGTQGNDPLTIWWHHLLYGQSPPGLDVRLTIDLELQRIADEHLDDHTGTLILLNAQTGEILVMASHPAFDPNRLESEWEDLIKDSRSPLINRATQGNYPTGNLEGLLFPGLEIKPELIPLIPETASPLEVTVTAAALSNAGIAPVARLVLAYHSPEQNWVLFPSEDQPRSLIAPSEAQSIVQTLTPSDLNFWQVTASPLDENLTWYLAGTFSKNAKIPLTLLLVLEERNPSRAEEIGQALLKAAIGP